MEILVKPNYAQVYNLCKYISVYQYSIDSMYQYSKINIGKTYPSTLMVILSLKMINIHLDHGMINFSTKKVLVYHTNYNMLNIAVVDTLL
jgi:hypothetical protein